MTQSSQEPRRACLISARPHALGARMLTALSLRVTVVCGLRYCGSTSQPRSLRTTRDTFFRERAAAGRYASRGGRAARANIRPRRGPERRAYDSAVGFTMPPMPAHCLLEARRSACRCRGWVDAVAAAAACLRHVGPARQAADDELVAHLEIGRDVRRVRALDPALEQQHFQRTLVISDWPSLPVPVRPRVRRRSRVLGMVIAAP